MPAKRSSAAKELTATQRDGLFIVLKTRFAKNPRRHVGIEWSAVEARLAKASPAKLWSLHEMERTKGEPDVVGIDAQSGEYIFTDCATQSPAERMSLCYDREALESRKEHKPKNSVVDMAAEMGVELLDEDQYFSLQKLDEFDTKTSSWIKTPASIRELGGALFCDRRYGRVFVGHNGAQSYYSGRGFRGALKI